jgi:hypothetical protein
MVKACGPKGKGGPVRSLAKYLPQSCIKRGTLRKNQREMIATTWGNLLEVENAFCRKNLISRVLCHITLREHKSNKGNNLDRITNIST